MEIHPRTLGQNQLLQSNAVTKVKVWCYQGWMRPDPIVANSAPPKGVDYKSWLGPAPIIPFNSSRFHFHFRHHSHRYLGMMEN